MKILVTGAEGFAGSWLVRLLLEAGHSVWGTRQPGAPQSATLPHAARAEVRWLELDLTRAGSVAALPEERWDAVMHLAALASGGEAHRDPARAWSVNAGGTAALAELLGGRVAAGTADPLFLLASTGEVYGQGHGAPRRESDAAEPCSPYAGSKLGAEVAALEASRRTGLRVVIARAFPHTGPGQDTRFVLPALAQRLRLARRIGAPVINTGNLEPVRDLLDVRDVAAAYLALLEAGTAGAVFNVASGSGHRLADLLDRMIRLSGHRVIAEYDPALARRADIMHLVGDPSALMAATGWRPMIPLDQTLQDLLDAQAD